MAVRGSTGWSGGRRAHGGGALLSDHHLAERLSGEQARNVSHFQRGLEPFRRRFAQKGFETLEGCVGDNPALVELGFRKVSARLLYNLAARTLHFFFKQKTAYDIEEI